MWSVSQLVSGDPSLETDEAKQLLRTAVRTRRHERGARARRDAADALAEQAEQLVAGASCVALYAARPTEPDLGPSMRMLHGRGVDVLLPMLGPGLRRDWALHREGDTLEVRAPGRPPDPAGPGLGAAALGRADLVLAPALAVDRTGVRLGQGGGWYDRVLEHRRQDARVLAVVFADEVSDVPLPRDRHDRPVDGVVTPEGWWLVEPETDVDPALADA